MVHLVIREAFQGLPVGGMLFHPQQIIYCPPSAVVGGGTIAKYVANRGIPVIDIGVPVLSMHSPFEVIHKTDLYMAYRTFSLFCQAEQ